MYHSQNNEAEIVSQYFDGRTGILLDIGANDGITFSNSYDLIEKGWAAILLEPSELAYLSCCKQYQDNANVLILNYGIGNKTDYYHFYESGAHVPDGEDRALVSSIHKNEIEKWETAGVKFEKKEILLKTWEHSGLANKTFNFISIDAEGCDWDILQQIDLRTIGCECICIEHNSNKELYEKIKAYCIMHGLMKELLYNAENIIIAK